MSATHVLTEMFVEQRVFLIHYAHVWTADATSALLTHILQCSPGTADCEIQISVRANYKTNH